MKITIDNLDGRGPVDYTRWLDATVAPRIERELNRPSQAEFRLVANSAEFVTPLAGGRVVLSKEDGSLVFTGYLAEAAEPEYIGYGEHAPAYRYRLPAEGDEVVLDRKCLPNRAPFVSRSAGSALRQLAEDLLPGAFDVSGVQDMDLLASFAVHPQKKFSEHAAEIALAARGAYSAMDGRLQLAPLGLNTYRIDEGDATFSPAGLSLMQASTVINDVTVVGLEEPQTFVRDYFVGDGLSRGFYLSQSPFQQSRLPLIDENFEGNALDPATWVTSDPSSAIAVAAQALQVSGGAGQDGGTTVSFVEQVEMAGALKLQHGDVSFTAASRGVIGGLYSGSISAAGCVAGFQVTPNGAASNIQAVINGARTGPIITTTAGHRYVLTTYVYSQEVHRSGQKYHSSVHRAGNELGGAAVPADVRFVLQVQDINPAVPATLVAPATVLYDDLITDATGYCSYALVNAISMQCSIAFTYVTRIALAEIRMAVPDSSYVTQVVGSLSDGAQCSIASSTSLDFYPQYAPPLNSLIVASYRAAGRASAEVMDAASIGGLANGADNGVRGAVRMVNLPSARTQVDCENAALAILDDSTGTAWSGRYEIWSDFLPGEAADIFPGSAVAINVPSQNAVFSAIVRKVAIELVDTANDRGVYVLEFANDVSAPLGYEAGRNAVFVSLLDQPVRLSKTQVGSYYLDNLRNAQVTSVSSTTVQVDAGTAPNRGWGIEVRAHNYGWGTANDRNLLGRYGTQSFTLPRLARAQTYFLRLYDSSSPPRYSRYAAALHVDYPL